MKHQAVIEQIISLWKQSQRILLTGASNLDGDALGCLLALYDLGTAQGKEMIIINEKPLSSLYDFLGVKERVQTSIPPGKYDAIFICDTGCFEMLGKLYTDNQEIFDTTPTVNIDHHASCYGDVCWSTCGYENTSATMMIGKLIEHSAGLQAISKEMATYLLLWVYYDTECFRNANTNAEGYQFAARMLELWADHNSLIRNLYQSTDIRYVRLYGEVLAQLQPVCLGTGVIGIVTQAMLMRHEIDIDSLWNELVNDYLRSVRSKFVVLIKETANGNHRMSFRSKDESYNMRELSGIFGGGGHTMASGACTSLSEKEIIQKIEEFYPKPL